MHVIIGCGNPHRQDDGVGVLVTKRLPKFFSPQAAATVRIIEAGTRGIDVLSEAQGARSLTIIDACVSGSDPGHIFTLHGDQIANHSAPRYSGHEFRWNHAVSAGQILFPDNFPTDITVYLIEAGKTSFGIELTPAVLESVDNVCEKIRTLILQGESKLQDHTTEMSA